MGIRVFTEIPQEEYTVIIDAVFGVGLSREITGRYCDIIRWMNSRDCCKVAVDIPSGVCARTGQILGTAFSMRPDRSDTGDGVPRGPDSLYGMRESGMRIIPRENVCR